MAWPGLNRVIDYPHFLLRIRLVLLVLSRFKCPETSVYWWWWWCLKKQTKSSSNQDELLCNLLSECKCVNWFSTELVFDPVGRALFVEKEKERKWKTKKSAIQWFERILGNAEHSFDHLFTVTRHASLANKFSHLHRCHFADDFCATVDWPLNRKLSF